MIARIYFGTFDERNRENWIYSNDLLDVSEYQLYTASYYFIVTTIMTVGYGDITAISYSEKILCIILMLIGVISFSFATGAISSIITS